MQADEPLSRRPIMTFSDFFITIHGHAPFPWQEMLADRERWPDAIDLPTASGKTACLDAAIYRLATGKPMPRRIWFIVDRRIVVDEAHDRAKKIAMTLATNPALAPIAEALRRLGGSDCPLAVARLRGGTWRDDSGWARDPRQPAIICSTVDQLGSSLLFRPYGHGLNTASIYAGLAANDSLILLDEAHCSEPFRQTLTAIKRFRGSPWCREPIETPFEFTIMSATLAANEDDGTATDVFPADKERSRALDHEKLHERFNASKVATLRPVGNKSDKDDPLVEAAAAQAKQYQQAGRQRIAVMVNRVNTAKEIHARLTLQSDGEIVLLTGRLRPLDRDAIVAKYSPLLKSGSVEALDKPIIIVTTQCLEVGADFSFDALVTECASLDALRQRFGRLDRLGSIRATNATILVRDSDSKLPDDKHDDPIYGKAIAHTWAWLTSDEVSTTAAPSAEPATKKKSKKDDATLRSVDFGINSLSAKVDALRETDSDRFKPLLAPQPDAPILLPAHLDLLCQTSPAPAIEPDVSLFLHGKGRHAPEVRVVFRLGLDLDNEDHVRECLHLLPPTSPECLSVPLYRLRQWLINHAVTDNSGDVEGESAKEDEQRSAGRSNASLKFILWKGKGEIDILDNPSAIKPNATIVLSADELGLRGALVALGQDTDVSLRVDHAEEAQRIAKGRVALRINESNFATLRLGDLAKPMRQLIEEGSEDRSEWKSVISELQDQIKARANTESQAATDEWLVETLEYLSKGQGFRIFSIGDPIQEAVLVAIERLPPTKETGDELDDEERSTECGNGNERDAISLADHTADVRRVAQAFTKALPGEWTGVLDRVAYAHDWGKLDPRFQTMLHGGDETQADPLHPLAKSAAVHGKLRSPDLPPGWEHAMLSMQIAQHLGYSQDDTELHLIASHHGGARPFAAIIKDEQAPAIDLTALKASTITEKKRKALTPAHDLASNVANRFWRLVRKHGWWGQAYLEAVFRLADWRASAKPSGGGEPLRDPVQARSRKPENQRVELLLSGMDGSSPLGMLAALGVTRSLALAWPDRDVRLHWVNSLGGRKAVLSFEAAEFAQDHEAAVIETVAVQLRLGYAPDEAQAARLKAAQKEFDAARKRLKDTEAAIKKRKLPPAQAKAARLKELEPLKEEVSKLREPWLTELRLSVPSPELALGKRVDVPSHEYRDVCTQCVGSADPSHALLAHFGSDGAMDGANIEPTPFSFINGSGHQFFLETARELIKVVTPEKLRQCLFQLWQPQDEKYSMRWLPSEDRRYALMAVDPGGGAEKTLTVWAANLLGYAGLGLLPSAPSAKGLRTAGMEWHQREPAFMWPLWADPLSPDSISGLISAARENQPVKSRWRAFRIEVGDGANKKVNFTPASAV